MANYNKKISVSLVIACFERAEEMRKLLLSLKLLKFPDPLEIIIVDDGSKNPQPLKNLADEFSCSLSRLEKNVGPSLARNIGAAKAKGEFLWFLDSDCEIENPELLTVMIMVLKKDPKLAGVGGEAVKIGNMLYLVYQQHLPNWMPLTRYLSLDRPFSIHPRFICTNNLLVSKKVFFSEGEFSSFFDMAEDQDLCLRLTRSGKKFLVTEKTYAVHYHMPAGREGSKFWFFDNTWNYLNNMNEARVKIIYFHFPYRLIILPFLDLIFMPAVFFHQVFFAKRRGYNLLKKKSKGRSQNFPVFLLLNLAAMARSWLFAWKLIFKPLTAEK